MTDLARKALLAALPALALTAASPASAGSFMDWMAGGAAATAPSEAAPSESTRAGPPTHHRRRHAATKSRVKDAEAKPDGSKPDGSKPDEARSAADGTDTRRAAENEAERRAWGKPAKPSKPVKLAGTGPTVLGDSIGIGLSMASGAPRLAHEGVAIRSSAALAQLHRVPDRSVVVLSLGTNDAVGSIRGVEGAIDRIRAVAERNDLRVVWLGPPCVFKSWNGTAERLDAVLKERLGADNRVRYVSAADPAVCDRSLRAGDGVHFTMRGYAMLWKRVVAAEGDWAARPAREAAARMPERAPDRTASNER